ncbi:hypothetical protein GC174_03535 [bacterium]|nr:hypothetical protein [bacterium]
MSAEEGGSDETFAPMLEETAEQSSPFLSPGAEALAKQLGVKTTIARLSVLQDRYRTTSDRETMEQIVLLKQQLTDILQYTSFQVQDALAAIDSDLAYNDQVFDYLSAKKEKREFFTTVGTFMATGALTVLNQAISFGSSGSVGNILGTVSGSTSLGVPTINLIPRKYDYPQLRDSRPNMLSQILERGKGSSSEFNSTVWTYLNTAPPNSVDGRTRRQLLLKRWKNLRQMEFDNSESSKRKLDLITQTVEKPERISLSVLVLRGNLLSDVRAEIGLLYRDLAELKAGIMAL